VTELHEAAPGEIVINENDAPAGLRLLLEGEMDVMGFVDDGHEEPWGARPRRPGSARSRP
jgi:hypothetical protein